MYCLFHIDRMGQILLTAHLRQFIKSKRRIVLVVGYCVGSGVVIFGSRKCGENNDDFIFACLLSVFSLQLGKIKDT